jgi:hypothetical protein
MHWWLIPAAASLPLLLFACSDAPPEPAPKVENTGTPILTYFTIPG